ncbi:helix-turn-helix transcriptional regulator [Acetomicrobium sp.]|uniref:helix-turn-helix domain-containing protein n=1 Tax=Acetomicrobium sp. TaxID=1872099 RepID=UPI00235B5E46|nr:helix-turn-helix transcriptional regulator [Acetomicrobium sp.]
MSLGLKIKRIRQQRGLTQGELASIVGVSPGYIQALESNKRNGSLKILKKIAEALAVDTSELFEEMQEKANKVHLDALLSDKSTEIWYGGKRVDERKKDMLRRILDAILLSEGE